VMVRGMKKDDFIKRPLLGGSYKGIDLQEFMDSQVILGYRLARRLGLRPGDTVSLVSPKGNITAFGTIPKMKAYTVLGVFDSGMSEYDANFLFMPLEEAQKFFVTGGKVSHLEVFTNKGADYEEIAHEAFSSIGRDAQIQDWRYTNQAFFNAIEVERNVMFLILTLIIIVAAFNMISGLIMLVQDKTKDIAVLRTMGMSRGSIQRVFLMSGLTIGVVGTFAGFGLGLLFCENIDAIKEFLEGLSGKELFSAEIYFLSKLPAKVEMGEVMMVVVMSLVLSLLSTIYPSYKASKTDPVEALRYE
ncbi:MAG: FtsX-like permease family protein, partial [Alphaproteobacteria bacterium]|nr:FtsX-like permease family protein [Alphaproteobacteria bacterium]